MDTLKIPLSTLPGKGFSVNAVVTEDELRPEGAPNLSVGPVTVHGQLEEIDGTYLFRGDVSGEYRQTCDRCLGEANVPFEVDVMWSFTLGEPEEELSEGVEDLEEEEEEPEHVRTFQNGEINLAPYVWEEVVLSAPSKFLCREDCAGLCPRCGANLNQGKCGCPPEEPGKLGNKGLQGLAEMFPDLKKVKPEE